MANQVVSVVPQRHEGNYDFLYVSSVFQLDANTGIEYVDTTLSLTDVTIKYKINTDNGASASFIPLERNVYLDGVKWPNLPENHKVTTALYQNDGTTKINEKSMDTKNGPILK